MPKRVLVHGGEKKLDFTNVVMNKMFRCKNLLVILIRIEPCSAHSLWRGVERSFAVRETYSLS